MTKKRVKRVAHTLLELITVKIIAFRIRVTGVTSEKGHNFVSILKRLRVEKTHSIRGSLEMLYGSNLSCIIAYRPPYECFEWVDRKGQA